MIYSEERIKNLALKIHDQLYLDEHVDYPDEDQALLRIKEVMLNFFLAHDKLDEIVKTRIASLKKGVVPRSVEWDILYQKYFEEELAKKKL